MDLPQQVVEAAVKLRQSKLHMSDEDPDLYILKVIGLEEYIYGDYPIIQFKVNKRGLILRSKHDFVFHSLDLKGNNIKVDSFFSIIIYSHRCT